MAQGWNQLNRQRDMQTQLRQQQEKQNAVNLKYAYKNQLSQQIANRQRLKNMQKQAEFMSGREFQTRIEATNRIVHQRVIQQQDAARSRLDGINQENMARLYDRKMRQEEERRKEMSLYRMARDRHQERLKEVHQLQEQQRDLLRKQLKNSIELKELNSQRAKMGEKEYEKKLLEIWMHDSDRTQAQRNNFLRQLKNKGQDQYVTMMYEQINRQKELDRKRIEQNLVDDAAQEQERKIQLIQLAQQQRRQQMREEYHNGLLWQLQKDNRHEQQFKQKQQLKEHYDRRQKAISDLMSQQQQNKKQQNQQYLQFLKAQGEIKKAKDRSWKEMMPQEYGFNKNIIQSEEVQSIPGFNLHDTERSKQLKILQRAVHADRYMPASPRTNQQGLASSRLSRSGMNVLL